LARKSLCTERWHSCSAGRQSIRLALVDNCTRELKGRRVADLAALENSQEISGVALSPPVGGLRGELAAFELLAALAAFEITHSFGGLWPVRPW
jgi:hypothetical protein